MKMEEIFFEQRPYNSNRAHMVLSPEVMQNLALSMENHVFEVIKVIESTIIN